METSKSAPQGITRLSKNRQVSIPAKIIDALGIEAGTQFVVTTDGKTVVLTPARLVTDIELVQPEKSLT